MTELLLLIADVLLAIIALVLVADYVHRRWASIQARWFRIRRKVFKR